MAGIGLGAEDKMGIEQTMSCLGNLASRGDARNADKADRDIMPSGDRDWEEKQSW